MAGRTLETLMDGGTFFEGPRWHDGRWWVSDFYSHRVLSIDVDGRAETVMTVEERPSGLGFMPDGSLLVVSMRDRRVLRRAADGAVTVHADVSALCPGHLNDMVVDRHGRAYVGNFGFDFFNGDDPAATVLVRVDPDGTASVAADDLLFPNGTVITPDGRTLIVGESLGGRYTAFTIAGDGSLGDRRAWAQVGPLPELTTAPQMLGELEFGPDGCTLDAEGRIWAADIIGSRCLRIAEGGAIVEELALPDGLTPFACALGGEDGRTLLVCAAPDSAEATRTDADDAVLLTTTVDVPHAGLP
jgi:sugar lactone lactonase YvrE